MFGFSLIETLVAIGLFTLIAGVGVPFSLSSLERSSTRTNEEILVATLLRARSRAIHSACNGTLCNASTSHGVMINDGNIVIFAGNTYENRIPTEDERFSLVTEKTLAESIEVIFSSDGQVQHAVTLPCIHKEKSSCRIEITKEGAVLLFP